MTVSPDRKSEDTAPDPAAGALPRHVALIMDGNGRWATARGLPRTEGHRHGLEALRRTIRHAAKTGIRYLTIYSSPRKTGAVRSQKSVF